MRYYHASNHNLDPGATLTGPAGSYESDWHETEFYPALDLHRPKDKLAHRDAVFLVADLEDINMVSGGAANVFEVTAQEPLSRHDLNWCGVLANLIEDGFAVDSSEVSAAAHGYWMGDPSPNKNVWEYLTRKATIVRQIAD